MPWVRRHLAWMLALGGLALGFGWVFAGPLPWPILVFLPLALVGSVVAFVAGVRWSQANHPIRRLATGFAITGLFILAFVLPIGAKRVWTTECLRQLPVLADATNRFEVHSIASGDGYPDYMLYYETKLSLNKATEALHDEFRKAGWMVYESPGITGNVRQAYCTRRGVGVLCQLSCWPGKTMIHIQHQDPVVSLEGKPSARSE